MADTTPRPPRRRPSRSERAVPNLQPGRCHFCDDLAVGECPQCYRPACATHLVDVAQDLQPAFGEQACASCARYSAEDLARDEGQWRHKRDHDQLHRTCSLCGLEFEQTLPQCSRCLRHLCPEHALRYRKRFSFGAKGEPEGAWYWDHETRCPDHRLNPLIARLRGWQPED